MSPGRSKERRRVPLVDSALLRFLSSQAKLKSVSNSDRQQQRIQSINRKENSIPSASTDNTQNNNSINNKGSISEYTFNEEQTTSSSDALLAYQVSPIPNLMDYTAAFSQDKWLIDYNTQKVADYLLTRCKIDNSCDVLDIEIAQEAGNSVQSVVLARTARRRFRTYIKDRDLAWETSTISTSTVINEKNTYSVNDYYESIGQVQDIMESAVDMMTNNPRRSNLEDVVDILLEYGLTIKDVAEMLIHSPGIALMRAKPIKTNGIKNNGETLQETLDRAFVGLLMGPTLNLRKYDARKVLRNTPGLLTMKGSRSATDIVTLLTRLGVSANSIARDKTSLPRLLSRSPESMFRLVAFLSSDAIRMPMTNIGPLLRRSECMDLLDAVAPVPWVEKKGYFPQSPCLNYQFHVKTQLEQMLHNEQINQVYRKMSSTAWTLRNKIGTGDLGKVIAAYPSVLLLDGENKILPTAKFLMQELEIWEDDLPRVLQLYPALLGMDINDMKKVVDYLVSLEVSPDNLSSIFRSFPSLLTMNVEKDMIPVIQYLSDNIGISNVGRFITRLPPVLGYSVDNELKPKWEYLKQISNDPRFAVSKFPAVFSYPLSRIKSRFEYLRLIKGMPIQILPFDQVLCYGDRDFAIKIARDKDSGISYIKYVDERRNNKKLLSSSRRQQQKNKN